MEVQKANNEDKKTLSYKEFDIRMAEAEKLSQRKAQMIGIML